MYYIFQEMFVCGVLFFLLVTNGKSRWHSGDFLLFFAGASCHDYHPAIALFILIFLFLLKNQEERIFYRLIVYFLQK